ncbi:MAG: DUF983 domain-containing protein [Alphaproteobacteria bacterium]|nr:DUF983 domain-containing protein [Alphaproteobacteria bacterium]
MPLMQDIAFCLKPRCPVCREGRLFKPRSLTVVDECAVCGAKLGQNDVGDGASVFLTFIIGFSVMPLAWIFEKAFSPPAWVHGVVWSVYALGVILLLLPVIKAYIILLEYRHRPGGLGIKPGEAGQTQKGAEEKKPPRNKVPIE